MNRIAWNSLACFALLVAPWVASAADVSDGAGMFSAQAIEKANEAIRSIEKKSGYQVRIETFATVPDGKAEAVEKMSKSERDTFFGNWEHDRAFATKTRGLYVLICKSPLQVRSWAENHLQQGGFRQPQAREIFQSFIGPIKANDYDKALADGVHKIGVVFDGLKPARQQSGAVSHSTQPPVHHNGQPNAPPRVQNGAPAQHQSGFGGVFWVMAIIIGGVLLFSFITRLFSGGAGYGHQPGYGPPGMGYSGGNPGGYAGGGGGGGGFMRSLAGGIFGAMAGNWLYDQFGGHHAHASDSNQNNPSDNYSNDNSNDDSFGGTDFGGGDGGDMGGGDMGGGDSGGGDFGGGDFGGGGGGD